MKRTMMILLAILMMLSVCHTRHKSPRITVSSAPSM